MEIGFAWLGSFLRTHFTGTGAAPVMMHTSPGTSVESQVSSLLRLFDAPLTFFSLAWTLTGNAFPPNAETEIGARMISEEPMYLVCPGVPVVADKSNSI